MTSWTVAHLCPWNSPGRYTGVGSHSRLLGDLPNPGVKSRSFQADYLPSQPSDYVDHNKLWKILKKTGIPDCLTCLLRNLYAHQEATVRTGHGTMDLLKTGKGVSQGYIL